MSIAADEGRLINNHLTFRRTTFRCTKCRAEDIYSMGVAGRLVPAPLGSR